jgi:fructokinase
MSIPTKDPATTFDAMIDYYKKWEIKALGIACFGPIDLDRNSKTYGYITRTPKKGWAYCDVVGTFERALHVPVGFDTDVNGAVLGEVTWGAAQGAESALYITIGTGVGVGVYINGGLLHGLIHPESGHIALRRQPNDTFPGCCPYHKSCVEGLASGPAIEARWGKKAADLADRDEVWELEADYIAQAIVIYILSYSPQKIILWGGVMHQEKLFPMVRARVKEQLNGYLAHAVLEGDMEDYIVPPALGEDPGIKGAIRLGYLAIKGD